VLQELLLWPWIARKSHAVNFAAMFERWKKLSSAATVGACKRGVAGIILLKVIKQVIKEVLTCCFHYEIERPINVADYKCLNICVPCRSAHTQVPLYLYMYIYIQKHTRLSTNASVDKHVYAVVHAQIQT
jgi:hypothetical protein